MLDKLKKDYAKRAYENFWLEGGIYKSEFEGLKAMSDKRIKITHTTTHSTCGEPRCCDFYDDVTSVEFNGETYEYESSDQIGNLVNFMRDVLGYSVEVEEDFIDLDLDAGSE